MEKLHELIFISHAMLLPHLLYLDPCLLLAVVQEHPHVHRLLQGGGQSRDAERAFICTLLKPVN